MHYLKVPHSQIYLHMLIELYALFIVKFFFMLYLHVYDLYKTLIVYKFQLMKSRIKAIMWLSDK